MLTHFAFLPISVFAVFFFKICRTSLLNTIYFYNLKGKSLLQSLRDERASKLVQKCNEQILKCVSARSK